MRIYLGISLLVLLISCKNDSSSIKPNIVLIMTDDQGWGETGYYDHPVLETPNLDKMAENGLRLDRFYASAPVCSPTRASVLTGRHHDRTGVFSHGYALRLQEKTISEALQAAGYATAHFGKWHLNGLMGPGVPIFGNDPHSPGAYGFDEWISVSNFFDIDPLMSNNGKFQEYEGTSSEVITKQAIQFIKSVDGEPFFVVIWDGSPHKPWRALEKDRVQFNQLDDESAHHYGELVAFDRSIGLLRNFLQENKLDENTLVWFCSDNGGLNGVAPTTVGHLRDYKGSLYEGGIRVPAIIEWPAEISHSVTHYPASTADIFPTIVDILDLPDSVLLKPTDGKSLRSVFYNEEERRKSPIFFRFLDGGAMINNSYKLHTANRDSTAYELYNLEKDPGESKNIAAKYPDITADMIEKFGKWNESVEKSINGHDYPKKKVDQTTERHYWMNDPGYEPYLEEWSKRWEYKNRIKNRK